MKTKKPILPLIPVRLTNGDPVDDTLRVWRSLENVVMQLSEGDLIVLLEAEKAGKGRRLFLQRLYGRMTKTRAARETKELKAAIKDA